MPQRNHLHNALIWAPLAAVSLALSGCASTGADSSSSTPPDMPSPVAGASADGDLDALLDIERMGVAVLAEQWVNNDCSVELALSPDDLVCATVLSGADLTTAYEDLGGGLGSLSGAEGDALRVAFEDARDAGAAWSAAGCAEEFDDSCADEAETLVSTLLALDSAFDGWAA